MNPLDQESKVVLYDLTFFDGNRLTGLERFSLEIYKRIKNSKNLKYKVLVNKNFKELNPDIEHITLVTGDKKINHLIIAFYIFLAKPNIVFFPAVPPSPISMLICLFMKKQVYRVIHDAVAWESPKDVALATRYYFKNLDYWFASFYKKIITVSKYSKSRLTNVLNIPSKRIEVLYNGISEEFISNSAIANYDSKTTYRFLTVGTIEPRKNYNFLLEVFSKYSALDSNAELVICGRKGWGYDDLMSSFLNLPDSVKSKVEIKSDLDDQQLSLEYSKATIFIFTSTHEGFGIPLIEAMSKGLPIVAANNSAIPEVLEGQAILIDGFDPNVWLKYLVEISEDKYLLERLSEASLFRAKYFSWDLTASGLDKILAK